MSPRVPEGWYADPQKPGERGAERWWNGASWTAHTRLAPPPEPVVRPPAQPAPAAGHQVAPRAGVPPQAGSSTGYPQAPRGPVQPWTQGQARPGQQAPQPPRPAPVVLADGAVLAAFGPRLSAFALDVVIVLGVTLAVSSVLQLVGALTGSLDVSVTPVLAVVWFGYQALLVRRNGQTPGKSIIRIRVRDLAPAGDGSPGVSWRGSLLRPLVAVGATVLPGGLGGPLNIADAVVMASNPQRRALHDLLAGTVVVEVPRPVAPGYVPPDSAAP